MHRGIPNWIIEPARPVSVVADKAGLHLLELLSTFTLVIKTVKVGMMLDGASNKESNHGTACKYQI